MYLWDKLPTDFAERRADPDTAVRNTAYPIEGVSRFTILSGDDYDASTLVELKILL
jgi:hypothetical protein